MRPRTLLILAVVVAALAAFIFWVERDLPSSERRAELAKRVLPVEADAVDAVVIEHSGERLRLEREEPAGTDDEADDLGPARWRLTEPLSAPADGAAVDRMVRDLVTLERQREVEGADPAAVGLQVPRARVTLESGGESHTLSVGSEVPAGSSVVVSVGEGGGDAFYVVSDLFWADLEKEAGEWRARDLFRDGRDDVERISVESPAVGTPAGERLLLGRRGDSFWLEVPDTDRADAEAVDELLGEIVNLRATTFVDEAEPDLAAMGLEAPEAVLEVVVDGRERPWRFELGDPVEGAEERRYARVDGRIVHVASGLLETLQREPDAWHSKALTGLEAYQVDRATVTGAGATLGLVRENGDWQRDGETIPYTAASEFLYALADSEGTGLIPPDEAVLLDLVPERAELTVELRGAEEETTLRLWPAVDDRVPAGSDDRRWKIWLDAQTAADIREKLEAVRNVEPEGGEEAAPAEETEGAVGE